MTDTCTANGCTSGPDVSVPVPLCRTHRLEVYTGLVEDLLESARQKGDSPLRMNREQAQRAFTEKLEGLFSAGKKEIGSWDFTDTAKRAGRSRSWIHYCLDQLTASGVLERDGTTYRKKEEQ